MLNEYSAFKVGSHLQRGGFSGMCFQLSAESLPIACEFRKIMNLMTHRLKEREHIYFYVDLKLL